jgi:hypothetical protein
LNLRTGFNFLAGAKAEPNEHGQKLRLGALRAFERPGGLKRAAVPTPSSAATQCNPVHKTFNLLVKRTKISDKLIEFSRCVCVFHLAVFTEFMFH